MIPAEQQATVYIGGGRRWFTKRAACRAEAKAKVKARCDCESINHGHMGIEYLTCSYHADADRFQKIIRRLSGMYLRAMEGAKRQRSAQNLVYPSDGVIAWKVGAEGGKR